MRFLNDIDDKDYRVVKFTIYEWLYNKETDECSSEFYTDFLMEMSKKDYEILNAAKPEEPETDELRNLQEEMLDIVTDIFPELLDNTDWYISDYFKVIE